MKRTVILIIIIIILLAGNIILGIVSINTLRTSRTIHTLHTNIERKIEQIIDDSSQIRKTLKLPELLYEDHEVVKDTIDYSETELLDNPLPPKDVLITQIDTISQYHTDSKMSSILFSNIQKLNLKKIASTYDLVLQQKNLSIIIKHQDFIVGRLDALYHPHTLTITGMKFDSSIIPSIDTLPLSSLSKLFATLSKHIDDNYQRGTELASSINTLFQSRSIALLLLTNDARYTYSTPKQSYIWRIYNIANQEIFQLSLAPHSLSLKSNFSLINTNTNSNREIVKKINTEIIALNFLTQEEQLVQANISRIKKYTQEKSFIEQLNSMNLAISNTTREDNDYLYLDIINTEDSTSYKLGSLAVQKSNGNFWSMDINDVPIKQYQLFTSTVPIELQFNEGYNILLVGSHNQLADTIILAHISHQKEIKLISIPRDLYYKGRKINWYFKRFSPEHFNTLISDMLGIPILQYVYVDMYSFVSIIDLLGGITVYLESDLIDPSYKIVSNGMISYLNYPQGEHHLSGIEALRIARSRYSTSDFNRSSRQQAILMGIKAKLNTVDYISSFISVLKIINAVYPHIITNITTREIAQMVQLYRSSIITQTLVLSTDNILYSTYSAVIERNLTADEIPSTELGQWILLPTNNNWNSLQLFIEQFILK